MDRKENFEHFLNVYTQNIENNVNFSHVKIGDGEIYCMRGTTGSNLDNHPYSTKLGNKIKESFIHLAQNEDVYIADWFYSNPPSYPHDFVNKDYLYEIIDANNLKMNFSKPFELVMMGWGNMNYDFLFNFYRTIKNSKRKKIYLCPERLNVVKDVLMIDKLINIPLVNAYSQYDSILLNVKNELEDDCIILLSVGMQSPVLTFDLLNEKKNITIIDIGSGFDPLSVGKTRGDAQASMEEAYNYLKNL